MSRVRIRSGTLQCVIGYVSSIGLLVACQADPARPVANRQADSLRLFAYIKTGDSVYALRQGYGSFAASLSYYELATFDWRLFLGRFGDKLQFNHG